MGRSILDPHEAAALLREMTPWSAHQHDHAHLLSIADRLAGHDQPAARLRRLGKKLRLGRVAQADIAPFVNKFAENPEDDAPHLVFADFLADHGDPREEIVRQQVSRGRQKFGEGRFVHPPTDANEYEGQYDIRSMAGNGERGWIGFTPHRSKPQVMVRWAPDPRRMHASSDYRAIVSPESAHEMAVTVGLQHHMSNWPEHAKPKNIPQEVDRTKPGA